MSTESEKGNVVVRDCSELDDLKSKRLWHELSLRLLDIAKSLKCEPEEVAKSLYGTYVQGMERRMNQSMLVEISYHLADHYRDPEEAVTLLDNAEAKMSPQTEDALALCKIMKAEMFFSRMNDMEQCKTMLDEAEPLLDGAPISEMLHGRYYLLAYKWHKKQGDHSQIYRNGLRYLGIVDVKHLPLQTQIDIARDLAVAAMIAEDVYNIGELTFNLRRRMKLKEIGSAMKLPTNEVEHLLMTAMAKGLIRGHIDGASGVVTISWVRPKVLSKSQLKLHAIRVREWTQEVKELEANLSEPETDFPESTPPRVSKPSEKVYSNYNF